jgi:hypothetical protein
MRGSDDSSIAFSFLLLEINLFDLFAYKRLNSTHRSVRVCESSRPTSIASRSLSYGKVAVVLQTAWLPGGIWQGRFRPLERCLVLDVGNGRADSRQMGEVLIGDFNSKHVFDRHHDFQQIQRIDA